MKKIVFLIVWLFAIGAFAQFGGLLKSIDSIKKVAGDTKKVAQAVTGISLRKSSPSAARSPWKSSPATAVWCGTRPSPSA